jgi:hypothetical protein
MRSSFAEKMNPRSQPKTAGNAWLRSLPIALSLPVPIWIINELVSSPSSEKLSSLFFVVLGIAVFVHLIAYAILGLPIFYRFYSSPTSLIWDIRTALAFGGVLGIIGICLTFFLFGYSTYTFKDPMIYISGFGYGVATGIAAYLVRPTKSEQAVTPNA